MKVTLPEDHELISIPEAVVAIASAAVPRVAKEYFELAHRMITNPDERPESTDECAEVALTTARLRWRAEIISAALSGELPVVQSDGTSIGLDRLKAGAHTAPAYVAVGALRIWLIGRHIAVESIEQDDGTAWQGESREQRHARRYAVFLEEEQIKTHGALTRAAARLGIARQTLKPIVHRLQKKEQ